jgi:hypothetical protein
MPHSCSEGGNTQEESHGEEKEELEIENLKQLPI